MGAWVVAGSQTCHAHACQRCSGACQSSESRRRQQLHPTLGASPSSVDLLPVRCPPTPHLWRMAAGSPCAGKSLVIYQIAIHRIASSASHNRQSLRLEEPAVDMHVLGYPNGRHPACLRNRLPNPRVCHSPLLTDEHTTSNGDVCQQSNDFRQRPPPSSLPRSPVCRVPPGTPLEGAPTPPSWLAPSLPVSLQADREGPLVRAPETGGRAARPPGVQICHRAADSRAPDAGCRRTEAGGGLRL